MNITAKVEGTQLVLTEIRQRATKLRREVGFAVNQSARELVEYIKNNKLLGQVLNKRTGRLYRSIGFTPETNVVKVGGEITSSVGTNLWYGKLHEYGFNGTLTVPAHMRRITKVFGRLNPNQGKYYINSHQRHYNLPERSFLRSSLREMTPRVHENLRQAVIGALQ